ncbi:hypothetical protein HWV62_3054 [Athelia sp. TMB]|nr:hypothetical protein HWV62_3054 [Athelia sp. TMB]
MNSLTYLSRQFDVLASPRAPPSTPSEERGAFLSDGSRDTDSSSGPALKRVKTWSTKSFLLPPNQRPGRSTVKRSFSSPSDIVGMAALTARPVKQALSDDPIISHMTAETVIRRTFIVRVLVVMWGALRAAWASLIQRDVARAADMAEEEGLSIEQKQVDEGQPETNVPVPRTSFPPPTSTRKHPISLSLNSEKDTRHSLTEDSDPSVQVQSPAVPNSSLGGASRASPPPSRKTPFHLQQKTLVLDLDETLIHSTSRPLLSSGSSGSGLLALGGFGKRNKAAGHVVEVVLGGRSTLYHVYKRPFVDYFLRKASRLVKHVSGWYTLVIFTASMQEYADPVIDWLDAGRGILEHRFFRDSCTQLPNGSYTKDLSVVEEDLARVCLVDNSPISYRINEANGIPIEGWTHDPSDEALLDLLPVLDSLRFTGDVRRVLGIRGFS